MRNVTHATAGAVLSTVAGGLAQVLTIAHLGLTRGGDSYAAALTLPTFALSIISGSFAMVLVPAYWRLVAASGEDGADSVFLGVLLRRVLLLTGAVAIGGALASFWSTSLLFPGLSVAASSKAASLAIGVWPILPLSAVLTVLSARENAQQRFFRPTVALAFPSIGIIGGWALEALTGTHAGVLLILGRDVGYVAAILLFPFGRRLALRTPRRAEGVALGAAAIFEFRVGWLVLSNGCSLILPLVERRWASEIAPGGVSGFFYASQLTAVISGLTSQAFSLVSGSRFSRELAVERDSVRLRRLLITATSASAILSLVVSILAVLAIKLMSAANLSLGVLSSAQLSEFSQIFAIYAFVAIPSAVGAVVGAFYTSSQRYKGPALVSGISLGLYLVASELAFRQRSLQLLALSAHVFWWAGAIVLLIGLLRNAEWSRERVAPRPGGVSG